MDAINFTIGILGLIVSSFAVYYARNSWLKPVPALIFNEKRFSSRKIGASQYLNIIDISISNDSQVTALFQDMLINGSSCKNLKKDQFNWTESGAPRKTLINHFNLDIKPGLTIKTGGNQKIEYFYLTEKPEGAVEIKIKTPHRTFTLAFSEKEISRIENNP